MLSRELSAMVVLGGELMGNGTRRRREAATKEICNDYCVRGTTSERLACSMSR